MSMVGGTARRARQRASAALRHVTGAGRLLVRLSAMLIVIAAAGVVAVIWQLREDAASDARRESANLSLMVSEQTARAVQAIDIVLKGVMEKVDQFDWRTPDEYRRVIASEHTNEWLRRQLTQIPQAESLSVIGADGYLSNSTRRFPANGLYLGDREYFRHVAEHADAGLFISAPVRNRITGTWTIYVARRLEGPDKAFLGLVVAAVELAWFDRLFQNIHLSRNERLFLMRNDGVSLVRYPAAEDRIGRKLADSSPWYEVIARGGGHYDSPGTYSGAPSLGTVSLVGAYPLSVNVLITYEAIFARWRAQAFTLGLGATVLLGCGVMLMLAVRRQMAKLRRSQRNIQVRSARMAAISRELRESKDLVLRRTDDFETTLQSMDQGIFLVDRHGAVTVYNQRALELLSLPDELLRRQPTFAEVLAYQWHENEVRMEDLSFVEFIRARSNFQDSYVGELVRPDGRVLEVRSAPTPSGGAVRIYTDVTARTVAERRVKFLAQYDGLTRLVNRAHFGDRLAQCLDQARAAGERLAVMYVDLDGFKEVNDEYGHPAGDALLVQVADRMRMVTRRADVVGRFGGDEFAVVLPALDDTATAVAMAERLIVEINRPFPVQGTSVLVGASIGIAVFPTHGTEPEQILKHADMALYAAKRSGKNAVRVFSGQDAQLVPVSDRVEHALRAS